MEKCPIICDTNAIYSEILYNFDSLVGNGGVKATVGSGRAVAASITANIRVATTRLHVE